MDPSSWNGTRTKNTLLYRGKSMHPTFQDFDLLIYTPINPDLMRCGDIIAFHDPRKNHVIIHRIISRKGDTIVTQGDNNEYPDLPMTTHDNIVGVVLSRQRNQKVSKVQGGRRGLLYFFALQEKRKILKALLCIFIPFYRFTIKYRLLSRITTPVIPLRIHHVNRMENSEQQLLCFGRIAGILTADNTHWNIKFPYSVIIDGRRLPFVSMKEEQSSHEN